MDEKVLECEAMRLPPGERALLADALISSLDDETTRSIEAAWAQEAESRLHAFHNGEITAVDGPTAIKEIRNRITK